MKKATAAEVLIRVSEVAEMILQGGQRKDVIHHCSENYKVGERQAEEYMRKATEAIKEEARKNIEENLALSIVRYNRLFAKNYKVQDFRECRNVQQAIDKLLGLGKLAEAPAEEKPQKSKLTALIPKARAK